MASVSLNMTQNLASKFKYIYYLEDMESEKKDLELPAQAVLKAVVVYTSSDVQKKILNETLK